MPMITRPPIARSALAAAALAQFGACGGDVGVDRRGGATRQQADGQQGRRHARRVSGMKHGVLDPKRARARVALARKPRCRCRRTTAFAATRRARGGAKAARGSGVPGRPRGCVRSFRRAGRAAGGRGRR